MAKSRHLNTKWFVQVFIMVAVCFTIYMFDKVDSTQTSSTEQPPLNSCCISEQFSVINEIDNKIFKHISKDDQRNFAFSAYGITQAIKAMSVLLGDNNKHKVLLYIHHDDKKCGKINQKESVLKKGIDIKKSITSYTKKRHIMVPPRPPKKIHPQEMNEATRIWIDKKSVIDPKIMNCYQDIVKKIKIAGDVVGACNTINNWVSKNTMGMITDLVQPDSIYEDSKIVVTNTLTFKGKWMEPFQKERTALMNFKASRYRNGEEMMKVKTMIGTMRANYYHGDKVEIAELPYTGDKYSMVLILPVKQSQDENKYGTRKPSTMTTHEILHILRSPGMMLKNTKLQVFLPKFKISSKFQLREILTSLGFNTIFNSPLEVVLNHKDLRFTEVLHRVVVEVNEEGTKASAGSAGLASRSFPMTFKVDRSFQFMIRNIEDDVVVFHGYVEKPEW